MFHSLDILRLFRGCVVYEITPLKNDPQKNDMGVKWSSYGQCTTKSL